jgi:hypothetical protein
MCKQCLWCWAASGSTLETRKETRHKPQKTEEKTLFKSTRTNPKVNLVLLGLGLALLAAFTGAVV